MKRPRSVRTPPPAARLAADVAVVCANASAWETLAHAEEMLAGFELRAERKLFPARWTRAMASRFAGGAAERGVRFLIVASPDERLPDSLAETGLLPVIRVPVAQGRRKGLALISPLGARAAKTPRQGAFATVAIGEAGAKNAALLVVAALALGDTRLRAALEEFRARQTARVLAIKLEHD